MKNRSAGRLGRLFFNAVTRKRGRHSAFPEAVVASHVVTLESRSPGSVAIKKRSTTDPGTLRAARHSRMTSFYNGKKPSVCLGGFTLIELLVVVLIIGILASIALPQYRVSVARTRYQQLVVAGTALNNAQKLFFMTNGEYPQSFAEMDISMGAPLSERLVSVEGYGNALVFQWKWGECNLAQYSIGGRTQCKSSYYPDVPEFTVYANNDARRYCHSPIANSLAQQVCRTETGRDEPSRKATTFWEYKY